ncbi:hypothetical protein D3C76_1697830 [compost metagenome]
MEIFEEYCSNECKEIKLVYEIKGKVKILKGYFQVDKGFDSHMLEEALYTLGDNEVDDVIVEIKDNTACITIVDIFSIQQEV